MRRAIGTDQARAVQRKHHGQVLQRHVVDQLVVAALQEGGINRHHRLQPLARHARSKGEGVLLSNANVVIAAGKALMELHHPRAFAHRRRNADQAAIVRRHVAQPIAKHLGEGLGRRLGRLDDANRRIELGGAVVGHRIGLGQFVAVAFFGDDMQELRAFQAFDVLQRRNQRIQIMAINRADVVEAELLKQRRWHHHALGLLL